jgi:hypothetical protein
VPQRVPLARVFLPPLAVFVFACALVAQDKKPTAIKLPDGTIVLYTANPNDAAPKIDGVLLSAKEYQQLLDATEQLKKLREAKPLAPSVCRIRGRVDTSTGKPYAKLSVDYSYRATAAQTSVLLGGQRAAPVAATGPDGRIPLLELTPEGLTAIVERPGDGTLTLEYETAIVPRGTKGEVGFELGLPRAAITSLTFEAPGPAVKNLTLGTRTSEPGTVRPNEPKRTTEDAARYAPKAGTSGVALGPIDWLEIAWESPAAPGSGEAAPSADAEIAVRVDETQVETTARLRLRGPAQEWSLQLPKDATVTVARANVAENTTTATVSRPADATAPWKVRIPDAGEWIVTAVSRTARPDSKDLRYAGPYSVPPAFAAGLARQTGTVRIHAPVSIRLSNYQHAADVRRVDPGPVAVDAPVAVFRYATAGRTAPTLSFEARPARGFTAIQPHHKLDLTPEGWRLRTELRIAPVRSTIEQVAFELPAGWRDPVVRPDERVDEVQVGMEANGRRAWTVHLATGMAEPFTLTLETLFALPETANEAAFALPRFLGATERETQVTVSVPEGLVVRGVARDAATATPLAPVAPAKPAAATQVTAAFESPVSTLELAWQPYRAELSATVRADIVLGERQMNVTQTVQLKSVDPIGRPVRVKGSAAALAFQTAPALELVGPGQWTWAVTPDAKEATLTASFSLPLPPRGEARSAIADVPLLWPDATAVVATVRVWGAPAPGARRPTAVQGPWEERAPEPVPDRDSLPWLTLAAVGSTKGLPLALELAEANDAGSCVVERAVHQFWSAPDGGIPARSRYLLKRWSPTGVDVEMSAAAAPSFFVNRERVDPAAMTAGTADGDRVYRIPLPEPRLHRTGLVLEIHYTASASARGGFEPIPPRLKSTAFLAPPRLQLAVPAGTIALAFGSGFAPDSRWGWRGGFPAPVAGYSGDELERWFLGGAVPAERDPWEVPSDDAVTGRLHGPPPRVLRLPRGAFVVGCSLAALVLGFGVSRLRPRLVGPAVAVLGALAVVAGAALPQPAPHVFAAALPGLAALAVALGFTATVRAIARRRVDYLPTFRRDATLPPAPAADSNARPSRNGSLVAGSDRTVPPLQPSSATG